MVDRSPALLVKIASAVDAENRLRPHYQRNGGELMKWPFVFMLLDWLQPEAGWKNANFVSDRHRKLRRRHSPEDLEAMAAGVQIPDLDKYVREVMDRGMRPVENPPAIPDVSVSAPGTLGAVKKSKPTAQERLEGIRRAEEKVMDRSEDLAEMEVEIEQAESRRRIAERMAEHYKKRAAFVKSALEMLKDIVVPMEPARWNPVDIPAVHIQREQDAVLVLSDIHFGDETKPDIMGALNQYNFEIAQQKAKRLLAGVRESLDMLREHGNVRRIKVLGLGDWVTGTAIFPGQAHQVEFGKMKQAMYGADEMANFYMELLELPGIEEVDGENVPGNHGRGGKKGEDPFEDNWDLVLYEFLKRRLSNQPRLKFDWHWSWWMKPRIRGWDFLCAHGDEVKGWAGIPNYGLRRWASKWREMLDSIGQRYDYGLIGHHHVEVEERDLIISGAWPGASFFSAKELQMGGPATQMFYSVSEDYGITWRRRLPLDPPRQHTVA